MFELVPHLPKYVTYYCKATRGGPNHGRTKHTHTDNLCDVWMCGCGDIPRQTDRTTGRLITILCSPTGGGVMDYAGENLKIHKLSSSRVSTTTPVD